MPIKQPDGNKVPENCCLNPDICIRENADIYGECRNCGYVWSNEKNWIPA